MKLMHRAEAIRILIEGELKNLAPDLRVQLLEAWWMVSEEDEGYEMLPEELREHLRKFDRPERPADPFYDPLLRLHLAVSFVGAQNGYLAEEVSNLTRSPVTVTGDPEKLFACPCCRYRTLEQRAEYDICKVCFWEDDGCSDPDDRSSPNRMTLGDGQKNFELFGACERRALEFVDQHGPRKYPRAAPGEE